MTDEPSAGLVEASMPAREPELESGEDISNSAGGAIGTVCRGFCTIVSLGSKLPSLGVLGVLDFDFLLFLERLLISASFMAATSRSLSSSSLVLRRPRSVKMGISSTSKISS
jgi:hypothetical protein